MVRLHLIGFTTDLKNLIFATRKGAKSGGYVVSIDDRLRNTLEEVARLTQEVQEAKAAKSGGKSAAASKAKPSDDGRGSKLAPREIQALLRQGKTAEQVAKLAETETSWIERFSGPILAERISAIVAVRDAYISKPRLGPSGSPVGDAVESNLDARKIRMERPEFEDAWTAVKKNGLWTVSFTFKSRGRRKQARFSYDPDRRDVLPLNPEARDLGWRAAEEAGSRRQSRRPRPASGGARTRSSARGSRSRKR